MSPIERRIVHCFNVLIQLFADKVNKRCYVIIIRHYYTILLYDIIHIHSITTYSSDHTLVGHWPPRKLQYGVYNEDGTKRPYPRIAVY